MKQYYIAEPGSSPHGPYQEDMVKRAFDHNMYPPGTMMWCEGATNWEPIEKFFADKPEAQTISLPPLPSSHMDSLAPKSEDTTNHDTEKLYYVAEPGSAPHGPYSKSEISSNYYMGKYPEGTRLWRDDGKGWIPINELDETETNQPKQSAPTTSLNSEKKLTKKQYWLIGAAALALLICIIAGSIKTAKERRQREERAEREAARGYWEMREKLERRRQEDAYKLFKLLNGY